MAEPIPQNKIEAQRQAWKRGDWTEMDRLLAEACAEGDRVFYGLAKDNVPNAGEFRWTVDAINAALDKAGYQIKRKIGRSPKAAA